MEKRIDGIEQQLAELKNLFMERSRSRRGRNSKRRSHRRRNPTRNQNEQIDGEIETETDDSYRSQTRSSSRDSSRDFGGRKLKIPIFRGEDAYGWIVRAERYFKLNVVDEEDKLDVVVIALEDKALNWYQWWEEQNENLNWDDFKAALVRRFQPGLVQNPFGPLLSIKQTSSVMKYREKFERESAPLKKEERIMLKGIFINGLKEEIQAELKLHAAGTLDELMDRALLLEEKNNALRKGGLMNVEKKGGGNSERSNVKSSKGFTRWEKGGVKEGSSSKGGEVESNEKKTLGNRLSQAELRERSRKGLCFKCGETWGRDHVCKLKHYQFVLMEANEEEETEVSDEESVEALTMKVMQLSLKSKVPLLIDPSKS